MFRIAFSVPNRPMSSAGSITELIERLKAGDRGAVQPLWERYYPRLVALARQRLQGTSRQVRDEEDIALSAFDSFCQRAAKGQYPDLNDRDNLWALLVIIISRKAIDLARYNAAQKRGNGASAEVPEDHPADDPTPELAAQLAEEFDHLLSRLRTPELRQVALWKCEGYTNAEIASMLDCALTTVERRLNLIRRLLEDK